MWTPTSSCKEPNFCSAVPSLLHPRRQEHLERRLPVLAFKAQHPTHLLHETRGDGEAETGGVLLLLCRIEWLVNPFRIFLGNARPIVGDGEGDPLDRLAGTGTGGLRRRAEGNLDNAS